MELEGPYPEGGHQHPDLYQGLTQGQLLIRSPTRCMFPDELLRLMWEHKASRYNSCGVAVSDRTEEDRKHANLNPAGTMWFATRTVQDVLFVVPRNCLPYSSVRTKIWNEERAQFDYTGNLDRGWRSALESLLKDGYILPHEDLSYLIGKDTRQWRK